MGLGSVYFKLIADIAVNITINFSSILFPQTYNLHMPITTIISMFICTGKRQGHQYY